MERRKFRSLYLYTTIAPGYQTTRSLQRNVVSSLLSTDFYSAANSFIQYSFYRNALIGKNDFIAKPKPIHLFPLGFRWFLWVSLRFRFWFQRFWEPPISQMRRVLIDRRRMCVSATNCWTKILLVFFSVINDITDRRSSLATQQIDEPREKESFQCSG